MLSPLEHRMPLTLPAPGGPFAVGGTRFDWVNPSIADGLAPLLVQNGRSQ
jgi:hypothetical protein